MPSRSIVVPTRITCDRLVDTEDEAVLAPHACLFGRDECLGGLRRLWTSVIWGLIDDLASCSFLLLLCDDNNVPRNRRMQVQVTAARNKHKTHGYSMVSSIMSDIWMRRRWHIPKAQHVKQ